MKLKDLPDDFTPEQFRRLDKESLDAIPYTRLRWLCQCKGCNNGTHVRDYGIGWWFLDRNSKNSFKNPSDYWMGMNNYWLCGKHNRLFKRLTSRFSIEHIFARIMDTDKLVRIPVENGDHTGIVQPIEKTDRMKSGGTI